MKRITALISAVLALAVLFCACSGKSAKPLANIFADMKTAYSVTDLVEFKDVSDLDRFYGIVADDVVEFAGGINNSGVNQEEIVMILAVDSDAAGRIQEALNNRYKAKLNETKNYNPEQYAILEKCAVEASGNYVFMFLSENGAAMTSDFKQAI